MQRGIKRSAAVGLGLAIATLLTACSSVEPTTPVSRIPVKPSSSTSSPPSREAFVREAEAVFRDYTNVSSEVARGGGTNPERLKPYLSKAEYIGDAAGAKRVADHRYRAVGKYEARNFTPQMVDAASDELRAYVCLDSSNASFVDAHGKSVQSKAVTAQRTVLVTFRREGQRLIIDRNETWSGNSVC